MYLLGPDIWRATSSYPTVHWAPSAALPETSAAATLSVPSAEAPWYPSVNVGLDSWLEHRRNDGTQRGQGQHTWGHVCEPPSLRVIDIFSTRKANAETERGARSYLDDCVLYRGIGVVDFTFNDAIRSNKNKDTKGE